MFNLIISIIAIALVVALAGASLYYGGDAFSKGSAEAKAATYVNQAQQIQAASTLFKASEGADPADVDALKNNDYMASIPKIAVGTGDWELDTTNDVVFVSQVLNASAKLGITTGICEAINASGAGVVHCFEDGADLATTISGADVDFTSATNVTVYMEL